MDEAEDMNNWEKAFSKRKILTIQYSVEGW